MAVMTSEASEGFAFEQKTQPVPSSDKMALDLDINGTSIRHETNLDLSPPELALNPNLATSPPSPPSELAPGASEINGSLLNSDAFSSNNTLATSVFDSAVDAAVDARPTQDSTTPAEQLSFSGLETSAPTAQQEVSASSEVAGQASAPDQFTSAESTAVEAAVEDHAGASTIPPVVEAPESDLRDTSIPPSALEAEEPILENNADTDLALRPADDVSTAPLDINISTNSADQPQNSPSPPDLPQSSLHESFNESDPTAPDHNPAQQNTPLDSSMSLNDTEMVDVPPPSQVSKVSREREDDDEQEPSAKRTKTEDGTSDSVLRGAPVLNGVGALQKPENGSITPHQSKEIIKVLRNVLRTQSGRNFRAPVVDLWPAFAEQYLERVSSPIDLGTIEKKVKENGYSNYQDFAADVNLIHDNAVLFNGPDHEVSAHARNVRNSILDKTSNLPREAAVPPKPAKKAAVKQSTPAAESAPRSTQPARRGSRSGPSGSAPKPDTFALGPDGVPIIRRNSTKNDEYNRPKRQPKPTKSKDLPYSTRPKSRKNATELKFCEIVLVELKKPKYARFNNAFLLPVDPVALGIPNYRSVIKSPMDLQTITSKLDRGDYTKAKEFESDVKLMISNCLKFNPPGNPVHDMGKEMEELFDREWKRKAQYISDHTPIAQSPSSSVDSDEDASDRENGPQSAAPANSSAYAERLIQEQEKLIDLMNKHSNPDLIEMQKDIVDMIKGKIEQEKQPPKKATKKSKAATSKPAKKSSAAKRGPTTSGTKKSGSRARYIGTIEKEVVSAGIGLLPEVTQERVMELIRGDAPGVEADDDGSLELDIESLTESTLAEIYDMILTHLPEVDQSIRKQKEQERARSRALAQPKQKKKNKPMSKTEQERKIEHLKNAVQEFERHGSGSQEPVMQTVEKQDDTSGDESSDSEEE